MGGVAAARGVSAYDYRPAAMRQWTLAAGSAERPDLAETFRERRNAPEEEALLREDSSTWLRTLDHRVLLR